MDLGTILCRVDNRQYPTVAYYIADLQLISKAAEEYWGDDPRGIAELSRAKALEDHTCEILARRISLELNERCKAIHAKGGPALPPAGDTPTPPSPPHLHPTRTHPRSPLPVQPSRCPHLKGS